MFLKSPAGAMWIEWPLDRHLVGPNGKIIESLPAPSPQIWQNVKKAIDLCSFRVRLWDADRKVETQNGAPAAGPLDRRRNKGGCLFDGCWSRDTVDIPVEGSRSHPALSWIGTPVRMNDHAWKHHALRLLELDSSILDRQIAVWVPASPAQRPCQSPNHPITRSPNPPARYFPTTCCGSLLFSSQMYSMSSVSGWRIAGSMIVHGRV